MKRHAIDYNISPSPSPRQTMLKLVNGNKEINAVNRKLVRGRNQGDELPMEFRLEDWSIHSSKLIDDSRAQPALRSADESDISIPVRDAPIVPDNDEGPSDFTLNIEQWMKKPSSNFRHASIEDYNEGTSGIVQQPLPSRSDRQATNTKNDGKGDDDNSNEIEILRVALKDANTRNHELTNEVQHLTRNVEMLRLEKTKAGDDICLLKDDSSRHRRSMESLVAQLRDAKDENNRFKIDVECHESQTEAQISQLTDEIEMLRLQKKKDNKKMSEIANENRQYNCDLQLLKTQVNQAEDEINHSRNENEMCRRHIKSLELQTMDIDHTNQLKEDNGRLEQEIERIRIELKDSRASSIMIDNRMKQAEDASEAREVEWRRRFDVLFKEREKMSKALLLAWGEAEVGVVERDGKQRMGYRYRYAQPRDLQLE